MVLFTVIHFVVLIVYTKFEDCSTYRCLADKMEKLLERKKNGQNKETDKPYVADSLIHSITYHTLCLYQISKS